MAFLIARELCRLRERNDYDRKAPAIEFRLERGHLAEVLLARQSGQMPEKDQQSIINEVLSQDGASAAEVV
jgi:hypothetical protein